MTILKIIAGLLAFVLALLGIGWLGTQVGVPSFALEAQESKDLGAVELPAELPAPVSRYVKAVFGSNPIPLIESAVVVGKLDLNINGLKFPGRFKIYHEAGKAYYHFLQMMWFAQPIMAVNERYKDGVGTLDQPGNFVENDPKVNSAANLGLWAESIWLPSIWLSDSRLRWESVDDTAARLIVPDAAPEEVFEFHFDPQTGLVRDMTTMRYQNPDSPVRLPWTTRVLEWKEYNGLMLPSLADVSWGSDAPWAIWRVETVLYNVDVSRRMVQFGGDFVD